LDDSQTSLRAASEAALSDVLGIFCQKKQQFHDLDTNPDKPEPKRVLQSFR
jgi:hypothetical protein